MSTKNLGQVSGIHIGKTPPTNEKLIWFDDTPSQRIHKIYDPSLGKWVVLQKDTISAITYSELVNLAKKSGLSLGSWYQIKDKANALALAVTSTKVKYTDQLGNILIDDLGTNIQYHVTSSNLTIDEVQGVFDETNKKIVFKFDEFVPDMTADDYVLGKAKKKNVWKLAKFKLSSFLSKVTGNSITWNGGFFFNFREAVKELFDKDGGIVSKETYDSEIEEIRRDINNVGKDNQTIVSNCDKAISDATKDEEIYKKKVGFVNVTGEPVDAQEGHTLQNIVNNFQRFINKFKFADGIRISRNYDSTIKGEVNNNDSVESAISKVWNKITDIKMALPEGWKIWKNTQEPIKAGDTYDDAIAKIEADREQIRELEIPEHSVAYSGYGVSSIEDLLISVKDGVFTLRSKDRNDLEKFAPNFWWSYEGGTNRHEDMRKEYSLNLSKSENEKILNKIFKNDPQNLVRGALIANMGSAAVSEFRVDDSLKWETPDFVYRFSVHLGVVVNEYSLNPSDAGSLCLGIILMPEYAFGRDTIIDGNKLKLTLGGERKTIYAVLSSFIGLNRGSSLNEVGALMQGFTFKMKL